MISLIHVHLTPLQTLYIWEWRFSQIHLSKKKRWYFVIFNTCRHPRNFDYSSQDLVSEGIMRIDYGMKIRLFFFPFWQHVNHYQGPIISPSQPEFGVKNWNIGDRRIWVGKKMTSLRFLKRNLTNHSDPLKIKNWFPPWSILKQFWNIFPPFSKDLTHGRQNW